MKIRLLFFAMLRDLFQSSEQLYEIRNGATVGEVAERVFASPDKAMYLKETVCFAVNCNYVSSAHTLHDGDELAFIPPVAGG